MISNKPPFNDKQKQKKTQAKLTQQKTLPSVNESAITINVTVGNAVGMVFDFLFSIFSPRSTPLC